MQIPTQNFNNVNLTDEERKIRNDEFIAKAKDTIGKVVRLEFKEMKTSITEADRAERKTIAETAAKEAATAKEFAVIGKKYRDAYENIEYVSGTATLAELPAQYALEEVKNATEPKIT